MKKDFKRDGNYFINWRKLSTTDKNAFSLRMTEELESIVVPDCQCSASRLCYDNDHVLVIEQYYCDIMKAIAVADSVLPRCKPGVRKHFWSDELDQLKTDSFNAFRLWEDVGRPKHGTVYLNKVSCSLNYKRALRRPKSKKDLGHGEILSDY